MKACTRSNVKKSPGYLLNTSLISSYLEHMLCTPGILFSSERAISRSSALLLHTDRYLKNLFQSSSVGVLCTVLLPGCIVTTLAPIFCARSRDHNVSFIVASCT